MLTTNLLSLRIGRVCNMNYHNITHCDMLNGSGIRVVLWVSGCSCRCKNCQNPQTWSFKSGIPFDKKAKKELFGTLSEPYIQGITFSGGHPLEKENIKTVYKLCKQIKRKFPTKNIWLYTGYEFESVSHLKIMKYIDVLVDGKYIEELRDISLKWRGSSNQRVIDVQQSLQKGKVILYCD